MQTEATSQVVEPTSNEMHVNVKEKLRVVVFGSVPTQQNELILAYSTRRPPPEFIPKNLQNIAVGAMINGKEVAIELFSTSGIDDLTDAAHKTERTSLYKSADVFIAAASVKSRDSFKKLEDHWIPEVQEHAPDTPFMIVGLDLEARATDAEEDAEEEKPKSRLKPTPKATETIDIPVGTDMEVPRLEAKQLAKMMGGVMYMEGSGKAYRNVMEIFEMANMVALGFVDVEEEQDQDCMAVIREISAQYPFMKRILFYASPLEQVAHTKPINELKADQDFAFTSGEDGYVCVWHLQSGVLLRRFSHDGAVLAFDASGEYVAVLTTGVTFYLWSMLSSSPLIKERLGKYDSKLRSRFGLAFPKLSVTHNDNETCEMDVDEADKTHAVVAIEEDRPGTEELQEKPDVADSPPETATNLNANLCRPAFVAVMHPWSRYLYRFPVPVNDAIHHRLRLIPSLGPECRNFSSVPAKIEQNINYVSSVAAYFIRGRDKGDGSRPMDCPIVLAAYDSGDIIAFDGITCEVVQFFPGSGKKLRWSAVLDDDLIQLYQGLTQEELKAKGIRAKKNGDGFEQRYTRGRSIQSLELISAGNVGMVIADAESINTPKQRMRLDSSSSKGLMKTSSNVSRSNSSIGSPGSATASVPKDDRFLCLVRCDAYNITFFSFSAGIPLKVVEFTQNKFVCPIKTMKMMYDGEVIQLFGTSTTRSGKDVIVHFSEPWNEIKRHEGLLVVKSKNRVEFDGFSCSLSFKEKRDGVAGAFHPPKLHALPFPIDFLDIAYLPRSHESAEEDMVLVGSDRAGSSFLIYLTGDEALDRKLESASYVTEDEFERSSTVSRISGFAAGLKRLGSKFSSKGKKENATEQELTAQPATIEEAADTGDEKGDRDQAGDENADQVTEMATEEEPKHTFGPPSESRLSSVQNRFGRMDSTQGDAAADLDKFESNDIHYFALFAKHQGMGAQIMHKYDLLASSASGLSGEDGELNRIATYSLLHEKDKVHCRSVYWWESLKDWFMLLKDHAEIMSLSFDSQFLWPTNGLSSSSTALSLNVGQSLKTGVFITFYWIAFILMVAFSSGYIFMGLPDKVKQYPKLAKYIPAYLGLLASIGLFGIASMITKVFECSKDSASNDIINESFEGSTLETCFSGVHFAYIIFGLGSFIPFFIISMRIRAMDGISGISREHWLSWVWKYDEMQVNVGKTWLRTPSVLYEVAFTLSRVLLLAISGILVNELETRVSIYLLASIGLFLLTVFRPAFVRPFANSLNAAIFSLLILINIFTALMVDAKDLKEREDLLATFNQMSPVVFILSFAVVRLFHFRSYRCIAKKTYDNSMSKEQASILNAGQMNRFFLKKEHPARFPVNIGDRAGENDTIKRSGNDEPSRAD